MMGRFAFVHNSGIVGNIVDQDDIHLLPSDHVLIQLNEEEKCEVWFRYNPNATPRFTAPAVVAVQQRWTAYQFLLRFTAEERAAFRAASLTNANVADFQQLAQAAQEIISDDPMTVAGMDYLVSQGLLTQARRDEILNG